MTRQNQHVLSDGIAQTRQRTQVDAECVQVRLHGMHAHIGRYAGDHLIGGKEQSARRLDAAWPAQAHGRRR